MISVIMPVYNRASYLQEAIDSILKQTYSDFEFIIVDDCSTDNSIEIIENCIDSRIKFVRNEVNSGVAKSSNKALRSCSGKYIALMDSDDIADLTRFEKQLQFMQANPDIVACGTALQTIGTKQQLWNPAIDDQQIRACLLFDSPIYNPTAIIKAQALTENAIFYNEDEVSQDYDLWRQLSKVGKLANLSEPLLKYRLHAGQTNKNAQRASANRIRKKIFSEYFLILEEQIPEAYFYILYSPESLHNKDILKLFEFFELIQQQNRRVFFVDEKTLRFELMKRLLRAIRASRKISIWEKYKLLINFGYFYFESLKALVKMAISLR